MGIIFRNGVPYGGKQPPELIFANRNEFDAVGVEGQLYIAKDENKIYRWENNSYVLIGGEENLEIIFENYDNFGNGEENKLYIAKDQNKIYRWDGEKFTLVGEENEEQKKELVFDSKESFSEEGEVDKLYIAEDENKLYRWDGEDYILISGSSEGISGTIEAKENQILIGDGKQWTKGSSFYTFEISEENSENEVQEYFITGPARKEKEVEEDSDTIKVNTNYYFGGGIGIEDSKNDETKKSFIYDCYLKVSNSATGEFEDNSKFAIKGTADVEIGNQKIKSHKVFNQEIDNTFLRIKDSSYIVVDDSIAHSAPPVMLIHGGNYIDFSDAVSATERPQDRFKRLRNPFDMDDHNKISSNDSKNIYPKCPWTENGSWVDTSGTIFHMHENSTFLMDGAPVFKMANNAVLSVDGNARMYIAGGDTYNEQGNYNPSTPYGYTELIMEPGTHFRMLNRYAASEEEVYTDEPIFQITPNQIGIACSVPMGAQDANTIGSSIRDAVLNIFDGNGIANRIDSDIPYSIIGVNYNAPFGKVRPWSILKTKSNPATANPTTKAPLLLIEGKTAFKMSAQNSGFAGCHYQADNGGLISDRVAAKDGGLICSQMLVGKGSKLAYLISPEEYTNTTIKIGGDVNSDLTLMINPNERSTTVLNISPDDDSQFYLNCTPPENSLVDLEISPKKLDFKFNNEDSKITMQSKKMTSIIQGIDIFEQREGFSHMEMIDGAALILRKDQWQPEVDLENTVCNYPSANTMKTFTFTTKKDYTGITNIDEILNNPEDFKRLNEALYAEAQNNSHFKYTSEYEYRYANGGQIESSVCNFEQKYITEIKITSVKVAADSVKVIIPSSTSYQTTNPSHVSTVQSYLTSEYKKVFGDNMQIKDLEKYTFSAGTLDGAGGRRYTLSSTGYVTVLNTEKVIVKVNTVNDYKNQHEKLGEKDQELLSDINTTLFTRDGQSYPGKINPDTISEATIWKPSVIRSDATYSTTITNFIYSIHLGHARADWSCPIQSDNTTVSEIYSDMRGPKIQLYDYSNLLIRGKFSSNIYTTSSYNLNGSWMSLIIRKEDFPECFKKKNFRIIEEEKIKRIVELNNGVLKSEYFKSLKPIAVYNKDENYQSNSRYIYIDWEVQRWNGNTEEHLLRNTKSPVVEFNDEAYLFMNKQSELMLMDNGVIHSRRNTNGEIEFIFGDNINKEAVAFTIKDLRKLKYLLSNQEIPEDQLEKLAIPEYPEMPRLPEPQLEEPDDPEEPEEPEEPKEEEKPNYQTDKIAVVRLDENNFRTEDVIYVDTVEEAKEILDNDYHNYSIYIGEEVDIQSIPRNGFSYCNNLIKIYLSDKITHLYYYAFYYCTNLIECHLGKNIKSIMSYSLSNTKIKEINLPDYIDTFENRSFYECTELESIKIPNNVKTLGEYTFYNCRKLKTVILPDSLSSIPDYCFGNCYSLNEIDIPSNNTYVYKNAFSGCSNLTIKIDSGNSSYNNYPYGATNVTRVSPANAPADPLPDDWVPNEDKITLIRLDKDDNRLNDVKEFIKYTDVTDYLKGWSYNKYDVIWGENWIVNNEDSKSDYYVDPNMRIFYQTANVINVELKGQLGKLGMESFSYCYNLKTVTVGGNISIIGMYIFFMSNNIKKITLLDNIQTIDSFAFVYCNNPIEIYIDKEENSIAGKPWGASSATVKWKEIE